MFRTLLRKRRESRCQTAAGIALRGLSNVAVGFAPAFPMALRSRNLRRVDRRAPSAAVRARILRHPLSLIVPPRRAPAAAPVSGA